MTADGARRRPPSSSPRSRVAVLAHRAVRRREAAPVDAQLLARQPALRVALGGAAGARGRTGSWQRRGQMMRRYTLEIGGRTFVVDVEELAADRFEVVVGDETYDVSSSATRTCPRRRSRRRSRRPRRARAAAAPPPRRCPRPPPRSAEAARRAAADAAPRTAGGGTGALAAPMPGVILEVEVEARRHRDARPGDRGARGDEDAEQHQVARATARSPRCASPPGQAVGHGDAIVRFAEG